MKFLSVALVILGMVVGCGSDDGPSYAKDHPRIYLAKNRDRLKASLDAAGPAAKKWKTTVDRWTEGQDVYGFEAWNAALMGQLTGEAKYCEAAVKDVDANVKAQEATIDGGSAPEIAHDDYLYIGDEIGDLALVYDWCYGSISGSRRKAWLAFAQQAIWNVWNPDDAKWGDKKIPWAGWAIDDPSDNYYYSFLRATMLFGLAAHDEQDGAAAWLTQFHDTKLTGELVPEFNADLVGGGSREGTGYGVSMRRLFELYDIWAASTGEEVATLTGHTRASMVAFLHQMVPTLDRFAPTGDQSRDSTASLFDYHRAYLEELVYLFPDDPQAGRVKQMLADSSLPEMGQHFMEAYDFLYENPDVELKAMAGMGTAYYAPGIGQLYARSAWGDPHATWINLIAGSYTQSHAHQDQGAIMIYKDGWLAYDPVIDSHSGLPQDVTAHSTVRISDGGTLAQKRDTDSKLVALHRGDGWLHAAADLTPAYKGSASVMKVEREIVYLEPDALVVYDRVVTAASSQATWQLAMPSAPSISGTRATMSAAGHVLSIERVAPAGAAASVYAYSADSDFSGGARLDETVQGGDNRFLHVIWIDGAVGTVTPGTDGVTVTVGGKTAVVQFSRDAIGGSVSIDGDSHTLGAGLDTLPE